jgi:hypothetical protein
MPAEPRDLILYNKIKKKVYKKIPKHSAYRSGILVQQYKKAFKKKYPKKNPYKGKKTKKKGLKRWFNEKWVNQDGKVGYHSKSDIYRPSKRITSNTPITHKELSKKEIKRARRVKYTKGRVKKFKKIGGRRLKKTKRKKRKNMEKPDIFKQFNPNLTPREMFKLGSFGGTYWRPINSGVTGKKYKNVHKKYPASWWKGIPEENLSSSEYDIQKNKYGVKVGTTLKFWESKDWIKDLHPYGWVHWYCDYHLGKRGPDDERQIKRWLSLAGSRGRFMRFLVTLILKKKAKWDDPSISPKIRQVLQHWGYKLTKKDFDNEVERRRNKKK